MYVFDRVDRSAGVADRRAAGRKGDGARRVVLADAAVRRRSRRRSIGRGVSIDDLIDFTPELKRRSGEAGVSRYKLGPIFTPPVVSKWTGPLATLMLPDGDRRRQLAGRRLRSRNQDLLHRYSMTLILPPSGAVPTDGRSPGHVRLYRERVAPNQRSCSRRRPGGGRRGRRGR